MGKPSNKVSKVSDYNLNSSKHKIKVSNYRLQNTRKQKKAKKKLQLFFEKIKDDSLKSVDTSQNSFSESFTQNTTISSVGGEPLSPETNTKRFTSSVIILENSNITNLKRKYSESDNTATKRIKKDGEYTINSKFNEPAQCSKIKMKCSTPITKNSSNVNRTDSDTKKFNNPNKHIKKKGNGNTDILKQPSINPNIQNAVYNSVIPGQDSDIINLTDGFVTPEDSFVTIDLTGSEISASSLKTNDFDYIPNSSLTSNSTSGNVTVLENKSIDKDCKNFAKCISKLNSSDKSKLLELIVQKLFNGCAVPTQLNRSRLCHESPDVSYIKEFILKEQISRNSVGSNIYNPSADKKYKIGLRMIVIDGSNVAFEYSKGKCFSVKGLKICIDFFINRGHVVKAFVPRFRSKKGMCSDPNLLRHLEKTGVVVFTPSREIKGKRYVPYDDRYIIQCAAEFGGVIVTGDKYHDLIHENRRWQQVIEERLLPFTWVNDMIMFPRDPLGKNGPTLNEFLRHPPVSESVRKLLCN